MRNVSEQLTIELVGDPKSLDTTKSPLRYPGGKTRAVKAIRHYIPDDIDCLCSPFLGGASVELSCAADGIKVYGTDAFEPVINFWKQAKNKPMLLATQVRHYYPLSRDKFYYLQKSYNEIADVLEQAAVFFVLNRSSYSGTTLSGGMSPGHLRFTISAIDRLRKFKAKNLHAGCADYKNTLNKYNDTFLYLDPPYANGGKLYGKRGNMHEGFNHDQLADLLKQRDGWILSYNDCPSIRKLYKKYKQIKPRWTYGMSDNKHSKELLILNA
ncbi:MAG: DNA adenine methylase [Chromatiales bacterium]|nr:DNA adenine methylase [Chromatiales bacterium]